MARGWYWKYKLLSMNVDGIQSIGDLGDSVQRATIDVTLNEAAELVHPGSPLNDDAYK
eukprot:gene31436-39538_t